MKATGIIRKMDDLGRVVIPKELRKSMKIRDGAPLEIFTHNGAICFKPYCPVGERDWNKAKNVLSMILPCGFTLLDAFGGEQATLRREAEEFNEPFSIMVDNEEVGFLVVDKKQPYDTEQIKSAIKILQALFSENA